MPTTYAIPNGRTVFDATTYTGDGSQTASFTNQFGFKPDLVWSKIRTGTTQGTGVFDSVRGTTGQCLDTAATTAEGTWNGALSSEYGYVSAFNSNGFSVNDGSVATTGGYVNYSGRTYVAWQWQAGQGTTSSNTNGSITSTVSVNATAGFSIVSYTGNGSANQTVGHGLGVAPSFIIIKERPDAGYNWIVKHTSLGASYALFLNTTGAQDNSGTYWGSTSTPTSTVFGVDGASQNLTDQNGKTYIAYCWAQIAGYSQFGSYTGNGSSDGPFVYLGFRPKFVMLKISSTTGNWYTLDTSINPYNESKNSLNPNTNSTETTDTNFLDILSNGFKLRTSGGAVNGSGATIIYAAFAENPFKYANAR